MLLQGKLKIARTAICDGAVFFFALQSGYVTVLPPGANVSCCCARLDVCHVEVLLLTGDFLSPGEPSYVRTLQLIPRLYILRRTVKVAQEREGKLKLEEFY